MLRSSQPSAASRDIAVRTTPLSMSIALKNSSSVPSHTEPPRGTMASPNTVMTIEPVREGSRFKLFDDAGKRLRHASRHTAFSDCDNAGLACPSYETPASTVFGIELNVDDRFELGHDAQAGGSALTDSGSG